MNYPAGQQKPQRLAGISAGPTHRTASRTVRHPLTDRLQNYTFYSSQA